MKLLARFKEGLPDGALRLRLPGSLGAVIVVVVVWALSLTSALAPWDDLIYDSIIRALPAKNTAHHEVVLVETTPDTQAIPSPLIRTLLAAGARHVALLQPIDKAEELSADELARITRGRPLPRDQVADGGFRLAATEAPTTLPPSRSGMFRQQWSAVPIGGTTLLTLEGRVASQLGREALPETFQVNFHQGRHIPRLPAAKAASVRSAAEIVRGKTVVVGPGSGPFVAELAVPGDQADALITRTEFHALALDTLLQGREVTQTGPLGRLAVLLVLAAILLLAFQPLQLRHGIVAAGATLAGFFALLAVLLRTADIWLPAQAFAFVLAGVFFVVYRDKTKDESRRISSLLASMEAKLHHRIMPKTFSESQEHWSHVVNLVDQTLQLNRSIFLDRVSSDHRVKEIAAMNCSLDAIDELRRDYERAPYTLAIEARGAIPLTHTRKFLRTVDDTEIQYLVPFILEGDVLGFWAFGVPPATLENEPDFLESVNSMAEQIAGLLYQRKLWMERKLREEEGFSRYVQDDTAARLNALQQAIAALDRRTHGLEGVFSGITTAAVLYDLFGRVVLINERMAELMAGMDVRPFETTANDLITSLTGIPHEEVRKLLDRMLRNDETAQFQVALKRPATSEFLLNVRPLPIHEGAGDTERHPFNLHGILLELMDIHELNRGFELKLELADFVMHGVAEEFAQIQSAQSSDCFDAVTRAPRCDLAAGLGSRLQKAGTRLDELRKLLAHPVGVGHTGAYPLAPDGIIAQVKERLVPECSRKQLDWSIAPLTDRALCKANPLDLRRLLAACCERLIDDATSSSTIRVEFQVDEGFVALHLSNKGFGMPAERLQDILAADPLATTAGWESVRKAAWRSRDWFAEFSARAELGGGLQFTIRLPRFH